MYGSYRLGYGYESAAEIYLAINPELVGPRDVYALRRYHPGANTLINNLAEHDLERHAAWTLQRR